MTQPDSTGSDPVGPLRGPRSSLLARMTAILAAFDDPSAALTLDQLSTRARLPRSTVHRIAVELVELGWLARTDRDFRLGARAFGPFGADGPNTRIRIAAREHLQELFLRTGLVVHFGVLHGRHEMYLDKIGGAWTRAILSRVGGRSPAHRTGGGRAMLALLSPEQVDDLVGAALDRPGESWTLPALHAELARIRSRHGIALDAFDSEIGRFTVVCGAVRTPDDTVVSMSVCGPAELVRVEDTAPFVRDAVRSVRAALRPGASPRG